MSSDELGGEIAKQTTLRCKILSALYRSRLLKPDDPGISLLEFDELTDVPREKMLFAINYLREKDLLRQDEKTDFVITAAGIDRLETELRQ